MDRLHVLLVHSVQLSESQSGIINEVNRIDPKGVRI